MNDAKAMSLLSALSHPTRLDVLRRLTAAAPAGMASGELAAAAKTTPTAMSPHLAVLARAGLVRSTRVGRNVVYRAVPKPIGRLRAFLADLAPDEPAADGGRSEP